MHCYSSSRVNLRNMRRFFKDSASSLKDSASGFSFRESASNFKETASSFTESRFSKHDVHDIPPTLERKEFTVGWLCPLLKENFAVFFDRQYQAVQSTGGSTMYSCGQIGEHNVVVAGLRGETGTVATAREVAELRNSFPNLRIVLLVGVAGGAPTNKDKQDIRLGDVVVSMPNKHGAGIMQYDFGTDREDAPFEIGNGFTGYPSNILVGAVQEVHREFEQSTEARNALGKYLIDGVNKVAKTHPNMDSSRRPAIDQLFHSAHRHKDTPDNSSCSQCRSEEGALVTDRPVREPADLPYIHHGLMASGNSVMRNASKRDELANERGILCFEMEAAGLSKTEIHWLVVRGICDYSDSHKNKEWQEHAAAVAAQYAKEVLKRLPPSQEGDLYEDVLSSHSSFPSERLNGNFAYRERKMQEIRRCFKNQKQSEDVPRMSIRGIGGCGKTQLAIKYCRERSSSYQYVLWFNADSPELLDADVMRVAKELSQKDKHPDLFDKAKSLKFLKNVLQDSKGPWLLVFDNYDRPNRFRDHDLAYYFPVKGNGEIIVTTQLYGKNLRTMMGNHIVDAEELEKKEAYQIMFPDKGLDNASIYTSETLASEDSGYDSEDEAKEKSVQKDDETSKTEEEHDDDAEDPEEEKQAWKLLDRLGYHALSVDIAGGLMQNGCWTAEMLLKKIGDKTPSPLSLGGHERYCKPAPTEDGEDGEKKLVPGTPEIVCGLALDELTNNTESAEELKMLQHFLAIVAQVIDYPIESDWFKSYYKRLVEMKEVRPWMHHFTEKDEDGSEVWSEVKFLAKLERLMEFTLIKKTRNHRKAKNKGSFTMHPIMRNSIKQSLTTYQSDRAQLDVICMMWVKVEEAVGKDEFLSIWNAVLNTVLGLPGEDNESIYEIKNGDALGRRAKYLAKVAKADGYPSTAIQIKFCKFLWDWMQMPVYYGPMKLLEFRGKQMRQRLFSRKSKNKDKDA